MTQRVLVSIAGIVGIALLANASVRAAQIIPTGVEYTNDTIEQAGQLQACIVTTAIVSPPAPEIVNFQLLIVFGRPGFKVTAGDVDWPKQSNVAKRISDANFSTAQFNHPNAFTKNVTTEGQLVGMLTDDSLREDFINAFFSGGYSIRFKRIDISEDRTYYVKQAPDVDVVNTFAKCVHMMAATP
ncbi:MAG: hypothetical protein WBW35_19180 [Xanthobacteraceae bacterium]